VTVKRGTLSHILDAVSLHSSGEKADIVVNCTALGSRTLKGVEDKELFPVRGQIVVVQNEADAMYDLSGTEDGPEELLYIMMRAAGGGTIIGGSFQKGNEDGEIDKGLAERIMQRALKVCPNLTTGTNKNDLIVIRNSVGLRPGREGGPRLEAEHIVDGDRSAWVVHDYGHSGYGYQTSYGCAKEAIEIIDHTLSKIN
jgi:D-amino-acid oxidase